MSDHEIYEVRGVGETVSEQAFQQIRHVLNQNQQALYSMIQLFPGGIFVYSAESEDKFSFVSENMLAMLGYTKEEFEHKFDNRFSKMIYHEDRARVLSEINTQIADGPFDTCFYRIEKKDGTLVWVHDEGHIVVDGLGHQWFYVVIVDITASVQAREKLADQYEELHHLINNVPASILVLNNQGGRFSVVAVNQYFCNIFGLSRDIFIDKTLADIVGLNHPDDREQAERFFKKLLTGQIQKSEIIFRIRIAAPDTYQWFYCSASNVRQSDGTSLVYVVFTDATYQKLREADFNRLIQELLNTNPDSLCALRLNLSQNTCSDFHGSSKYIRELLDVQTADELLDTIGNIITDEAEAEQFRQEFNRKKIIERFLKGENRMSVHYHRLTETGQPHWVTTYFQTLANPYTDDVETVAYSVDTDRILKKEMINEIITEEEYDYIGVLHIQTQQLTFYYISKDIRRQQSDQVSHDQNVQWVCGSIPSEEERQQYLEAIRLERILAELERHPVYTLSYFCNDFRGDRRKKQLKFRYLENSHLELMFSRTDVTDTFEQEEKNASMLRQALLAAEKANELKTEFLGNVSHDMRTPLNAILGYNQLALQAEDTTIKDDYLNKIGVAGRTLLSLINDTLDLQKIENGTVAFQLNPVSCRKILQEIITSVQPMMAEKRIDFIVDSHLTIDVPIQADAVRLRQIFINLLSNAAKFTQAGGQVELVLECTKVEEKRLHGKIIVRDTGVGMSQAFLHKMYEPFSQERTTETAHIGGAGLGLSIVKRLVDMMGGRIEAVSEPGKGSVFTVYLNFERALSQSQDSIEDSRCCNIAGTHILLCEDNTMNMEIAKSVLEMNGAVVDCALNGLEGYEKFVSSRSGTYSLILMDIRMPVLDGYGATEKIRTSRHADAAVIPILAMTADAYAGDIEKSYAVGMNGHLAKPVDFKELCHTIQHLVHLSHIPQKKI